MVTLAMGNLIKRLIINNNNAAMTNIVQAEKTLVRVILHRKTYEKLRHSRLFACLSENSKTTGNPAPVLKYNNRPHPAIEQQKFS